MKSTKKLIAVFLLLITLASCSGDGYDDFIGYWQKENSDRPSVIQIKSNDGTYLFVDTVLTNPREIPLSKQDNRLLVNNGAAGVIALTDSGTVLKLNSSSFKKITETDVQAIKDEETRIKERNKQLLEAQRAEAEAKVAACDALKEKYKARLAEMRARYPGRTAADSRIKAAEKAKIQEELTPEKDSIEGCQPFNVFF